MYKSMSIGACFGCAMMLIIYLLMVTLGVPPNVMDWGSQGVAALALVGVVVTMVIGLTAVQVR